MAPNRWARRVRETAREQRTRDRSRLLPGGAPEADDWTQPIQGLEGLHVAAQGAAGTTTAFTDALELMEANAAYERTTFDDYLRQWFDFPPPMDITNVSVDVDRGPLAPIVVEETWAPVMVMPLAAPRYTVRVNGRMGGRTQEQWDELNRWTQEPAHGVVNTVMTQRGDFHRGDRRAWGTEIEITAHPMVPPGQAYIVNEQAMQQVEWRMAPPRDPAPYIRWEHTGMNWEPARPTYDYFSHDRQTPEQAAAAAEERKREQEERDAKRKAIQERAMNLFLGALTPRERQEYDKSKRFSVRGSRGTDYQISCAGQSGNVWWYDKDGELRGSLCAHPEGYLPDPDAWLAQRLLLMTDEKKFVDTSCRISGKKPEYVDA